MQMNVVDAAEAMKVKVMAAVEAHKAATRRGKRTRSGCVVEGCMLDAFSLEFMPWL